VRVGEAGRQLFLHGLTLSGRETIGTEATLRGADAAGLRAFYKRWYRPDRTTVVMVGDMDPAVMIELIGARFGSWRAEGPAPAEPDFGRPTSPATRVDAVAYPGAPNSVSVAWTRPYQPQLATRAQQERDLEESLARTIINRRLERRARAEAPFISAGLGGSEHPASADITQLSVTARGARWQKPSTRRSESSPTRCGRRRARLRSSANSPTSAPPPRLRWKANRPWRRRCSPTGWSMRSTSARWCCPHPHVSHCSRTWRRA
jgi:zinc protease